MMNNTPLRSQDLSPFGGLDTSPKAAPSGAESAGAPRVGEPDVLDLIRRADDHALGRDFLITGAQDAVAVTFGVHAFVVDAAREHLA